MHIDEVSSEELLMWRYADEVLAEIGDGVPVAAHVLENEIAVAANPVELLFWLRRLVLTLPGLPPASEAQDLPDALGRLAASIELCAMVVRRIHDLLQDETLHGRAATWNAGALIDKHEDMQRTLKETLLVGSSPYAEEVNGDVVTLTPDEIQLHADAWSRHFCRIMTKGGTEAPYDQGVYAKHQLLSTGRPRASLLPRLISSWHGAARDAAIHACEELRVFARDRFLPALMIAVNPQNVWCRSGDHWELRFRGGPIRRLAGHYLETYGRIIKYSGDAVETHACELDDPGGLARWKKRGSLARERNDAAKSVAARLAEGRRRELSGQLPELAEHLQESCRSKLGVFSYSGREQWFLDLSAT